MWTPLPFGKYIGKTLPQVIALDPDWVFWAVEQGAFKARQIKLEAEDIAWKAKNIKIPGNNNRNSVVDYYIHPSVNKFSHFEIVPRNRERHEGGSPTVRRNVIDLSVPKQIAAYDKLGGKNIIKCFRSVFFGEKKMTKQALECFFSDPGNFNI